MGSFAAMSQIRKDLILIFATLLLLFHLEQFALTVRPGAVSYLVLLVCAAFIFTIALPFARHLNLWFSSALWAGVYLVYRMVISPQRPFLAGTDIYVTISEVAILLFSVYLAHRLMASLQNAESVIEKMTFAGFTHKTRPLDEAIEDIQLELTRSRRYDRPLSVLVVKPMSNSMKLELRQNLVNLQEDMVERFLVASVGQAIGKVVRRSDIVIEQNNQDRYIILCPETSPQGLEILASRIQESIHQSVGVNTLWGASSFPSEALTFESLLQKAEDKLNNESNPDLSPRLVEHDHAEKPAAPSLE